MSHIAIKYWVSTYNALPNTKKIFDCRCHAIDYIKKFVDEYIHKVPREELKHSYLMMEINPRTNPRWRDHFLETPEPIGA